VVGIVPTQVTTGESHSPFTWAEIIHPQPQYLTAPQPAEHCGTAPADSPSGPGPRRGRLLTGLGQLDPLPPPATNRGLAIPHQMDSWRAVVFVPCLSRLEGEAPRLGEAGRDQ
jgi:hypothetical protein